MNALWLSALLALGVVAGQAQAQSDPVGTASSVAVVSNVEADSAYAFKAADFKFTDSDTGDNLVSITIKTLPSLGTLRVGENAATTNQTVTAADIGTITYYPEAGASPSILAQGQATRAYTAFDFTVTTGTGTNAASTADTTMSIVLVSPTMQIPASGTVDYFNLAAGTTFDEGEEVAVLNSGIIDPNGKPATSAGYSPQLQQAQPSATDPTMPGDWQDLGDALDPASPIFVPLPEHVGTFLRVCTSFTDGHATPRTETVCSGHRLVVEVADSPTGGDTTVDVPVTRTAANPHRFALADFPFSDVDGDERGGIRIITTPTKGTLVVVGDADLSIAANTDLSLAQLQSLAYYPDAMATTMDAYATFTYRVRDDSPDTTMTRQCSRNNCNNIPGSANLAISAATLTIDLVPGPTPATGAPTVAASDSTATAHNEDVELTASTAGINEPNGINTSTVMWIWQQAPAPESGAPADDAWATISGAPVASATFTPTQANVGNWLRACVFFTDSYTGTEGTADEGGTPEAPTLCSVGALVANVNDAPTSADNTITVFTNASQTEPHTFKAADFPFMDEDGDSLASISIAVANLPTGATLTNDGTALTTDATTLSAASLGDLQFYPASGATATENYASLTFSVSDGTATSDTHTLTLRLAAPGPVAPTGIPAITGTAEQKATLTAGTGTVADDNGINQATIAWQWQQAAAADSTAWAAIADAIAVTFAPTQAQVAQYVRVCMTFTDNHSTPTNEGPLCSTATGPIANVNDAPEAKNTTYQAARDGNSSEVTIPASAFAAAYNDIDDDDPLSAVTITRLPPEADGTLQFNGMALTVTAESGHTIDIEDGEFMGGDLTFTIAESAGNLQETSLDFTLRDSEGADSAEDATLTITFGKDIEEEQVNQVSAILTATALTNANTAISGAIAATATDLSLDGTSLAGITQTLGQGTTPTDDQTAWYHSTTPEWEHNAAWNATDNSRASLLNRLQSMANGDIALNYQPGTSPMRFWARYQSLDINGNEGEMLEYDGSGTGFYLGADRQITGKMRLGLAISTDSADITLDLDKDGTDDEATRSATSFYPYLHIDLGNNNNARVIAGFGSGTLDIKSTANSNNTASADLSWNMLAASISHHRPMKGNLSARFDGSLQLGNSSTDETTFSSGSTLMAADSSTNELSINAELRYQKNNITPFASLAARKLGGDLSQSMALDMAFGADLQTSPANLRFAITRQINDTTHQRHSISLDASTNPSASGISASLGSRYDSITGKPQWQSTIGWQRRNFQTSLQASPGDYRLRARLRW